MYTTSSFYTQGYYLACVDVGADTAELNHLLGHGDTPFANPTVRFSCQNVLTMLKYVAEKTGQPNLGLKAGMNFRPSTFANVGHAILACNTLQDALAINHKYQSLTQQFGVTHLELDDKYGVVHWTPNFDDAELLRPVTEAAFVGYATIARWLLWSYNEDILRLNFRHKEPANAQAYHNVFGCEIHYQQPQDSLVCNRSLFAKELKQANPELLAGLVKKLDLSLAQLNTDLAMTELVFYCVQELMLDGQPTIEATAESLNISKSQINSRLKAENTTFRKVVQQVRMENAYLYLKEGKKSLNEISLSLGYSEHSAFTRAYKSWYGRPPSEDSQMS